MTNCIVCAIKLPVRSSFFILALSLIFIMDLPSTYANPCTSLFTGKIVLRGPQEVSPQKEEISDELNELILFLSDEKAPNSSSAAEKIRALYASHGIIKSYLDESARIFPHSLRRAFYQNRVDTQGDPNFTSAPTIHRFARIAVAQIEVLSHLAKEETLPEYVLKNFTKILSVGSLREAEEWGVEVSQMFDRWAGKLESGQYQSVSELLKDPSTFLELETLLFQGQKADIIPLVWGGGLSDLDPWRMDLQTPQVLTMDNLRDPNVLNLRAALLQMQATPETRLELLLQSCQLLTHSDPIVRNSAFNTLNSIKPQAPKVFETLTSLKEETSDPSIASEIDLLLGLLSTK